MPSRGDRKMAMTVLLSPAHWMPSNPACATPAPTMPPTSAWLDEEGMPLSQVTMFQNIAPTSAPNTTAGVTRARSEEHTSELQSLMRNSYAVFCLKTKNKTTKGLKKKKNHGITNHNQSV